MDVVGVYIGSSEYELSKVAILKGLVTEKMTTAVREILAVVETAMTGYENEVSLLRLELGRHKKQLDAILQPRVNLCRIGLDDDNKNDSRYEHMQKENEDYGSSETSPGKNGVDSVPINVSHEETLSMEQEENDYTLGDLPSDSSVSCPSNKEESHNDDEVKDDQNKGIRRKRRKRLPIRYRSNSIDSDNYENDKEADNEWKPDKNKNLKSNLKKNDQIKLRIGLLINKTDNDLSNNDFRLDEPVQTVMCSQNLSESDFLYKLQSTFPELKDKPFEAFLAQNSQISPHLENWMTPKELYKAFRSTRKRQFFFSIQPKEHKDTRDSLTNTPATSNDDNNPSTSFHCGLVEEQLSEKGTSNSPDRLGNMSFGQSAAESNGEEDDNDNDVWEPEENHKDEEQSDASVSDKTISGFSSKKKKRKTQRCTYNIDSCKVCGVLFRSKSILTKHALSHVNNPKSICGVCGQEVESTEELRCHLETHQKFHQCDTCGLNFISLNSFKNHIATHGKKQLFKCQICQKEFAHKTELKKHKLDHNNKPYKCDTCHESFWFKTQLDAHNRKHTGEKPYCCDTCGKFLSDFRSLCRHKLIHKGQKDYSCKCGKRFYTLAQQKTHEKIHTIREKNFLCDICSKTFHTQGTLRAHQKRHEDYHIIKCSVCNKVLKGNLEVHMRIHTGEKPFSCSECNFEFRTRSHLVNHLRIHRGVKPYTCQVCGMSCGRKHHLDVHMRTHTGHKPYKCKLCDKAFTQSHSLKTHMKCHQTEEQAAADYLA